MRQTAGATGKKTQDSCLVIPGSLANSNLGLCISSPIIVHLRKTIFILRGLRPPPSGPFEHIQWDFFQLPLSMSCQYVLIVCMFSRRVEAIPSHKAGALRVAKKLLENASHLRYTFHNLR